MIILINVCGFFSNFFKVLNWELINNKNIIIVPYFITRSIKFMGMADGNNGIDKKIYKDRQNIWEIMFHPIREYTETQLLDPTNMFASQYPQNMQANFPYPLNQFKNGYIFCNYSIYTHPLLPQIRQVYHNCYNKFKWTPYLKEHIENNLKLIPNPKRTVAALIRYSGHYEGKKDYLKNIIVELKEVMKNYDKLFLVTMIKSFVKELTDAFGDKIIFLVDKNMVETENHDWQGFHANRVFNPIEIADYEKECIQCFTDVYLASTCDYILGGSSNMLLGALVINPTVKFKIFDIFENIDGA